ncbi:hypothetical protein LSH36_35g02084 [Paralvinella palmiformis]|uniref:Dynein light chain roadblock n=1 Tax=Paralvinella palmiformis TaxID=53620 RepID=A0AAD9NFK9_9ANNE|nr:hypothetical protein LSH36_35g02084 [Paralvinella palmiformis]
MSGDLDETIKKLYGHKGVKGIIITNNQGITVRSHFPDESAEVIQNYAAQFTTLASKAKEVIRGIDPTNQLTFIRVRSKKHEIMIAPGEDFIMITIQQPQGK